MEPQTVQIENTLPGKHGLKYNSLQSRSDSVLIAIAVLGLVATIVDGAADHREIDAFTNDFRKRFALSRRDSLKLITAALKQIRLAKEVNVVDCACDTLNEYLDLTQKLHLFNGLVDILVSDGKVHNGEEYFLDYLGQKLNLVETLEVSYAYCLPAAVARAT